MTGNAYRDRIAAYLVRNYGGRGVRIYKEVTIGVSSIGKGRRVDLLVLDEAGRSALALECKYQGTGGTADEKIPYALQDLAALRMPSGLVYAGPGWSQGVLHLLQSSEMACFCQPPDDHARLPRKHGDRDAGTWQLDHLVAMSFGWWEILVEGKQPIVVA